MLHLVAALHLLWQQPFVQSSCFGNFTLLQYLDLS